MTVCQQQCVAASTPHRQGRQTVHRHLTGVAQQAQLLLDHVAISFVVFGQQDQLPIGQGLRHRRCGGRR